MSSVDNHRQVNMAPTAIQPILFYTIVTEGHYMYMLCSNEERFEKVEQSCLTVIWKISCQRSHNYVGVHGVATMFLLCQFGLLWFILKFNFV